MRELRERADAARFGAVAPVLELPHELLSRSAGALPQRCELGAHRVLRMKRARLRHPLLEVGALGIAQGFFVAVQPALKALQHVRVVRRKAAALPELLDVRAL